MVLGQILKSPPIIIQEGITKDDKDFAKRIDFKDIKSPVKLETSTKLKKIILLALAFFVMKTKVKYPIKKML